MPRRPLVIGITGNIASGKSTFCHHLDDLGLRVHYADSIAKEVLSKADVTAKLISRWGEKIMRAGKPDHAAIASIVFADPDERSFLNSLVHPETLKQMQKLVSRCHQPSIIFEVPLLFEADIQDCFDFIVLVTCPADLRLHRIIQRDGGSAEQAKAKIVSQMPEENKIPRSDLLIRNTGDPSALYVQAERFAASLPAIRYRVIRPFAGTESPIRG